MISVEAALHKLFSLVAPLETETVDLREAAGRVLAEPVIAARDQPPFAASAMDGYAVRAQDIQPGSVLKVIGEAAAGRRFAGVLAPGAAVRIFTGAPMPKGADSVLIQEDTRESSGGISATVAVQTGAHVRAAGADFASGYRIEAPRRLRPTDLALAAAMNAPRLTVVRRPVVALLATGDELLMPGESPGPDQIIASNIFGLKALLDGEGAAVRILPIARDTEESLRSAFMLADGVDLFVTIGGASVGDHDLVAPVAESLGMERAFYKVAMRPGKPLMAGRLRGAAMVGLPGNPVSAMVCGMIFLVPMVRAMLGLGAAPAPRIPARLGCDLPANGPREHYMRARIEAGTVVPYERQDSSLLTVLTEADALLVRPAGDGARRTGDSVEVLPIGSPARG